MTVRLVDQAKVYVKTLQTYLWAQIKNTPTSISGYGITDAYTKTEVDKIITDSKALAVTSVTGIDAKITVITNSKESSFTIDNVANAVKAAKDGAGNVIVDTYATKEALANTNKNVADNATGITDLNSAMQLKAPLASPTFTGKVTVPAFIRHVLHVQRGHN